MKAATNPGTNLATPAAEYVLGRRIWVFRDKSLVPDSGLDYQYYLRSHHNTERTICEIVQVIPRGRHYQIILTEEGKYGQLFACQKLDLPFI